MRDDMANQMAGRLARRPDPEGIRIIGDIQSDF
jgi:hypothetical protein